MSIDNRFRHQLYHVAEPLVPCAVVELPRAASPESPDYHEKLVTACQPLGRAQIAAVYLVHGTFVGNDALGMLTELRRFAPRLSEALRRFFKATVNAIVDETGNYTPRFAHTFQQGLSAAAGRDVPVELFNWSSQNNHIGRADGAVRLIARLADLAESFSDNDLTSPTPPRVMLWGHSHGGNVFALVTNLLSANRESRQAFFDAARVFYTPWFSNKSDMPVWQHVEELLETDHRVRRLSLDFVTFGTPIRYGWHSGGYQNLLHFVNHRPSRHLPHHRTRHPLRPLHLLSAAYGDYIHQLGIAGTNLVPVPLAVRTFLADWRLNKVLQPDVSWLKLLTHYAKGRRTHDAGPTLLVDYGDVSWRVWHHLAGHAAYTRRCWLPFHVTEIADRFYLERTGDRMES
jgi:hypothetical protein